MYKCRPIVDDHFVWFNSKGIDENGKSIKYREDGENFAENQDGVAQSLTQRLSVIRSELWYYIEHGIPLFDKIGSKVAMDIEVVSIIEQHPYVRAVDNFTSSIIDGKYSCNMTISTEFGNLELSV